MATGPLIVIVGETASGKSTLAVETAKQFNGEIICADSWTVYKGFDIGTAKPTKAQQRQITHHLLDIANPKEGFNAPQFKRLASSAITDITKRDKLPILAGGSALYIDSVLFDYGFLPAGPAGRREELNKLSLPELMKQINERNLDTEGIDMRNKRRLIRLLETAGQRPGKKALRPNTLIIGLAIPKNELEKRIKWRVEKMLAAGLEHEVKQLTRSYGWEVEPMKGIGYREFKDYFSGNTSLEETKEKIIRSTFQLAKKQRTWFKRNKSIHWMHDKAAAVELLTTFLNK